MIMFYHETQRGLWCGLHAINNALQRREYTAIDCLDLAEQLNGHVSDSIKMALAEGERELADRAGNLDVTVVVKLLERAGFYPEIVLDFKRALELSKSSTVQNQSTFIVNGKNHYVTYRLVDGQWWLHNSLNREPLPVSHQKLLAALAKTASGSQDRLGRRVIYFRNLLEF